MAKLPAEIKSRHLYFVDGYVPNVDGVAAGVRVPPPWKRLALAQSTFYPEIPGAFWFDHELAVEHRLPP